MEINNCFFAYRKPGSKQAIYGSSEGFIEGLGTPGFVIGRFLPQLPIITIPFKNVSLKEYPDVDYKMPEISTQYQEYMREFYGIQEYIEKGYCNKVVGAVAMVRNEHFDIQEKFLDYCRRFPETYVFCFSTPKTGTWIGASPELLLEGNDKEIHTMSLAGTRDAFMVNDWSKKNRDEQQIVTDYIKEVFLKHGLEPLCGESFTKRIGQALEHICTPIRVKFKEGYKLSNELLESFLKDLSPTPALCGYPKEKALKIIEEYENFDRGCYGGFCGIYNNQSDFTLNVVLRCASVEENRFCIYAGGGITAESISSAEWFEIEGKIRSVFGKDIIPIT